MFCKFWAVYCQGLIVHDGFQESKKEGKGKKKKRADGQIIHIYLGQKRGPQSIYAYILHF